METQDQKSTSPKDLAADKMTFKPSKELPDGAIEINWPLNPFNFKYTTGPFILPESADAIHWTLLNNDSTQQTARVTIFRIPVGEIKAPVCPPGAMEVTIAPGEIVSNTDNYPSAYMYEAVVECNSQLVFPYVSCWAGNSGVIPGTFIHSGSFIRVML